MTGGEAQRVRVAPIRDPDTARILGWVAQCYRCGGYSLASAHARAMTLGARHDCPEG